MPGRREKNARRTKDLQEQEARTPVKYCGATKRTNGKPCLQPAGKGTDHPGYGHCKDHGGNSPSGISSATKAETAAFARAVPTTPSQALQTVLDATFGDFLWLQQKVAQIPEDEIHVDSAFGPIPNRWVKLRDKTRADLARYASAAASAGIQERAQVLAESQAELVHSFMQEVLNQLGLTQAQQELVGPAMRRTLAALLPQPIAAPPPDIDGTATDKAA